MHTHQAAWGVRQLLREREDPHHPRPQPQPLQPRLPSAETHVPQGVLGWEPD